MAVTPDTMAEAVISSQRASEERAARWFSSLGPFARSMNQPFDPAEGVLGARILQTEAKVKEALPQALKALEGFKNDPAGIQERSRQIFLLAEEYAKSTGFTDHGRQAFKESLISALVDDSVAADYLTGFKGQFIDSSAGQQLLSLAQDETLGAGNMFMLGMANLQARMVEGQGKVIRTSNPRISFKFDSASHIANLEGGGLNPIKSSIEDITSAILLGTADSGRVSREKATELVKSALGASDEEMTEIAQMAHEYLSRKGMSHAPYDVYRKGLSELGLIGEGDSLHKLAVAFGRLRDSNTMMNQVILPSIQESTDEATATFLAEHIRQAKGSNSARVQVAMNELIGEQGNEALAAFTREIEIPDVGMLDGLVGGLEEETRELASKITDPAEVNNIAASAIEARNLEFRAGNPTNQARAAWEAIQNRIDAAFSRLRAAKLGAPGVTGLPGDTIRVVHEEGLKYATAAAERRTLVRTAHMIGSEEAAAIGKKVFNRYTAPLLAIGGALALLSARTPSTHKQPGEDAPIFTGLGEQLASNSEQTSGGTPPGVWHGEETPFKLGITFRGFAANRHKRELFVRQVHNIITNNMEVKRVNSNIQDKRNQTHTMAALEAMRGY
jgi:hypothetical protein